MEERSSSRVPTRHGRFFAPKFIALAVVMALTAGALGMTAANARTARPENKPQSSLLSADPAPVHGVADDGTEFNGTFTVKKFHERQNRLYAVGTLEGVLGDKSVNRTEWLPVTGASNPATAQNAAFHSGPRVEQVVPTPGACDILDLVLGPLDLDLLGLRVALDTVHLLIEAIPGAGNLLGNLLCAVAGLLDPGAGGLGGLIQGILDAVANLLNQLLGGLGL